MINLQHPLETIELSNGDKVTIVDIPQINIIQQKQFVDEALKEFGREAGDVKSRHTNPLSPIPELVTWGEYFDDCVKIWQSFRKEGSVEVTGNSMNYGISYWDSLTSYLSQVSDTMHNWFFEKLNDFKDKSMPSIDELTSDQAALLVENVLKKKSMDSYVDKFRWTGLRNYITFLEKALVKLQEENLQNTISTKQPKEQKKNSKITK